jgi:hypothetical protein
VKDFIARPHHEGLAMKDSIARLHHEGLAMKDSIARLDHEGTHHEGRHRETLEGLATKDFTMKELHRETSP